MSSTSEKKKAKTYRRQQHPSVEKAKVALFTYDGFVIAGDCTYVSRKIGKEAVFEIVIIKKL